MKRKVLALLTSVVMAFTVMPAMAFAEEDVPEGIPITEEYFPDDTLRAKVEYYDDEYNYGAGYLSDGEISQITDVGLDGVTDFTGLEYLTALTYLKITNSTAKNLDLRGMERLQELYIDGNEFENIDLAGCNELYEMHCENNNLTGVLDLSQVPNMREVYAEHNNLTGVVLSAEADYYNVYLRYNNMKSLADMNRNGNDDEYLYQTLFFYPQDEPVDVELNAVNFPDSEFREIVAEDDDNGDGVLSAAELEDITDITVFGSKITSIKGVEYLTSMRYLACYDNYLEEIGDLPDGIIDFNCDDNYIKSIEHLPDALHSFSCRGNQLTTLPDLPDGLVDFNVTDNQLTSLPELPEGIVSLQVYDNQLITLPELPSGLRWLMCQNNQLSSLPELPEGLEYISCYNNQLTALPELPESLTELRCDDNNLTFLPELPDYLAYISCNNNEITTLPVLPKYITELQASNNKISGVVDVSNAAFMEYMYLSSNLITGVVLSPSAEYKNVNVNDNFMESEAAVTGKTDITWGENGYYFGTQKTYCDVYGHEFVIKADPKASFSSSGHVSSECKLCDQTEYGSSKYLSQVKVPTLSATKLVYNGSVRKPVVTVKDYSGTKLKAGTDYTVKYAAGRKNVGKYKVTVTLKGNYKGSKTLFFTINPKGVAIASLVKGKKAITVKWKKPAKNVRQQMTGYQIRYSTKQNMSSSKTVKIKNTTAVSKKLTGLKANKRYYVQLRAYKVVNGKTYYSAWSNKKNIKTK